MIDTEGDDGIVAVMVIYLRLSNYDDDKDDEKGKRMTRKDKMIGGDRRKVKGVNRERKFKL